MQNKKSVTPRGQRGERGFDLCVLFYPFIALLVAYTQLSSAAPTLESTPSALQEGGVMPHALSPEKKSLSDSQYTVH